MNECMVCAYNGPPEEHPYSSRCCHCNKLVHDLSGCSLNRFGTSDVIEGDKFRLYWQCNSNLTPEGTKVTNVGSMISLSSAYFDVSLLLFVLELLALKGTSDERTAEVQPTLEETRVFPDHIAESNEVTSQTLPTVTDGDARQEASVHGSLQPQHVTVAPIPHISPEEPLLDESHQQDNNPTEGVPSPAAAAHSAQSSKHVEPVHYYLHGIPLVFPLY